MASVASSGFSDVDGLPFLGSILPLSRDARGFFTRVLREQGDRVRMKVLGRDVLLLAHPQDIEQVLVRDQASYGRSAEVRKLAPIFGAGLLSSEGELWSRQRKMIQPSFRHDALAKYASIMLSVTQRQMLEWRDGAILDVHREMMRYTRDVICAVLFGEDFAAEQPDVGEAVSTVFGGLRSEVLYLPIWRRLPFRRSREWNRAVAVLNEAVRIAIDRGRKSEVQRTDLLAALLGARDDEGNAMSDQQIHDEILTFFLAGHETAALGLTWTLHLLASNPDVQEIMRNEIQQLVEDHGEITPAVYSKLRWTTAVAKESMRLYPPVWSMGRKAVADTTLDGNVVKSGTDVWLCLYQLHRDARWFVDPDRFLPERWLREPAPKPFTYMPFGIGQRVCIGQHFAMMEIVLGLAAMVKNFQFERGLEKEPEMSAWITLRPQRPILVRVKALAGTKTNNAGAGG
jgi:cytochrome P450